LLNRRRGINPYRGFEHGVPGVCSLPAFAESHGFYPWMNAKRVSAEAAYFAYGYEG